jgi:hypothetical protein
LNTYAWLNNEPPDCYNTIANAIADTDRAIELYRKDDVENRDVVAECYSNLALFYALEVTRNLHSFDQARNLLNEARRALMSLKTLMEKTHWSPEHPEYFYTEAFLEYQEYLIAWASGQERDYLIRKLRMARREIDTAINLYPEGPQYRDLKRTIDDRLNDISSGRLSR